MTSTTLSFLAGATLTLLITRTRHQHQQYTSKRTMLTHLPKDVHSNPSHIGAPERQRPSSSSAGHTATAIKHADVAIDIKDPVKRNEGICHVCREICDGWNGESDAHISIKVISGGITNLLFNVSNIHGSSVLVRIFGENTDVMINRTIELEIFNQLSLKDFGPKLFGTFRNGRIEGFFPNSPSLEPPQMGERSPVDYPRLIAQALAQMHNLQMDIGPKDPCLWTIIDRWSKMASRISFPNQDDKARALEAMDVAAQIKEIQWLKTQLPSPENGYGSDLIVQVAQKSGLQDAPEVQAMRLLFQSVFAHNDMLSGNLLYVKDEKRIQLIDFEYGAYNFVGFDIANHFCEYAGFDFDIERWYPDHDRQVHFLQSYLETLVKENKEYVNVARLASSQSDEKARFNKAMVDWINRFALASHMFWGLWAVIQSKYSPIDFDFIGYAKLRFDGYVLHKQQVFGA